MANNKRRRKGSRRHRSRRWRTPARWPLWAIWGGAAILLAAYACAYHYFFVAPSTSRWKAMYGETTLPQGYEIHGIDVSHHQGDIDWDRLRNANLDGVPIRFVFIKATEGARHLDENFNENFYMAGENGFIRGVYHYFKPNVSAADQARYFLKQVHLEPGDFPPVLDIEERGGLTTAQLQRAAQTWLDLVEARYHVKPILYTNHSFKQQYLNTPELNAYPYWIAHYYVQELRYKGPWRFWQHSDVGRVDGIKGYVDLDIYNGSMYDLQRFCIGGEAGQ